jgi:hypothetical protein
MEIVWSLQYCLSCDRQTEGAVYCSLRCRLVELSTSSNDLELSIPMNSQTPSSKRSVGQSPGKGFFLPPAFDFSAYCRCSSQSTNILPSSGCAPVVLFPSSRSMSSDRTTTPSQYSAHHSSIQQGELVSNKARNELRSYANSFDQVRDWRRKMLTA